MHLERILILARFEEHVRTLLLLVNANEELKETVTDAMRKLSTLLGKGRSITKSDYSLKNSKLTRAVKMLSGLVEEKDLEL